MAERADALDVLQQDIIEILAHWEARDVTSEQVSSASDRTISLCAELQAIYRRVIENLQKRLVAGNYTRTELLTELRRYIDRDVVTQNDINLHYDSLDVLIAGLLDNGEIVMTEESDLSTEMIRYQPTPAHVVIDMLEQLALTERDVFCDIGSGLGHVSILAALLTDARCIGVEMQSALCRLAQQSAQRLRVKNARFICVDAREMDWSVANVFYMYTPFIGGVLQSVLAKLSAEAKQRRITLCIHGPYLADAVKQLGSSSLVRVDGRNNAIEVFQSARH
jgi:precorrin-6B methylase 2